jgi:hypothetical protein
MLLCGDQLVSTYPVSTSRFGVGSEAGSFKTPVGKFRIGEKIGAGLPSGTIFKGRMPIEPGEAPLDTDDLIFPGFFGWKEWKNTTPILGTAIFIFTEQTRE